MSGLGLGIDQGQTTGGIDHREIALQADGAGFGPGGGDPCGASAPELKIGAQGQGRIGVVHSGEGTRAERVLDIEPEHRIGPRARLPYAGFGSVVVGAGLEGGGSLTEL